MMALSSLLDLACCSHNAEPLSKADYANNSDEYEDDENSNGEEDDENSNGEEDDENSSDEGDDSL